MVNALIEDARLEQQTMGFGYGGPQDMRLSLRLLASDIPAMTAFWQNLYIPHGNPVVKVWVQPNGGVR